MYTTPIYPGFVYHIFNRGINHQAVFLCDADKKTFLKKAKHYLTGYASVLSYCLLDNHYHLMVMILENSDPASNFSKQFGKLVLSYTHYFNKKYGHVGPIFHRRFKRLIVQNEQYVRQLFWYINSNPLHHRIVKEYRTYEFSSIRVFLYNNKDDFVDYDAALKMFPSKKFLIDFLQGFQEEYAVSGLLME
jgi:REP element-mobilizing transposase RayT